jgi:GTP cyclohydrolase I
MRTAVEPLRLGNEPADRARVNDGRHRQGPIDVELIAQAVQMMLRGIGEDPDRDGLRDTPARVARMYEELFSGLHADPAAVLDTTFEESYDGVVLVRDITFYSICEHHLLPFFGKADVAYVPNGREVTGLSKLARLVEGYARRPQVQERLTDLIADAVDARLQAVGTLVVVEAEHLCMVMRGVHKPGSRTTTMAARGRLAKSGEERLEVLRLMGR